MTLSGTVYDVTVALLIFLAALVPGYIVLRLPGLYRPDEQGGTEHLWLAAVVGSGLLSVSTMLLGSAGLFYQTLFVPLISGLAIIGASIVVSTWRQWWPQSRQFLTFANTDRMFRPGAYLLLAMSASTVVWVTLTHGLMPPHEWDEISYHLALPAMYIDAHRLIYVPSIVHSNWPMNSGMLYTIVLMFGSDVAVHLLNIGQVVLIAAGLLIAAQRFIDERAGILAATLFLTAPLVQRLAGTGLVDIAPGLYTLAALVSFGRWQQQRTWSWLAICGACCGFAAGSKLMGGGIALLFGLLLLIDAAQQRPFHIKTLLKHSTVFGIAGLLTIGPWYARSFINTGNPIWPFAYSIFGGRNWDTLGDEYHTQSLMTFWTAQLPRTPTGLVQSLWYMLTRPEELDLFEVGFGVVLPVGVLGGLVLVWYAPRFVQQCLVVGCGFYLLWFMLVSPQLRFLLPVAPLFALAAAYCISWLYAQCHFSLLRLALLAGLLALLANIWPWASPDERALLNSRLPYLRGAVSREAWLDRQVNILPLLRYANAELPANARILLVPYETRGYYLRHDYVWGNPVSQRIIPFEQFSDATELAATLHKMGITHVIDSPTFTYNELRFAQQTQALLAALQTACGTPLYRHNTAVLYALTPCV